MIKKDYLVKKRNVLNEIRSNNMTLQELRFFSIYLSKINPNDLNTRVVRFSFADFKSIMDIKKITLQHMKNTTNSLLSKVVNVPNERGGYTGFQLFKECTVDSKDGEWYVEIDAHDKALPLMFEFKEKYFTYELWNALKLKSYNQLRMYELLKQYEKIGYRILKIDDLRDFLGISKEEYKKFNNFKERVLDSCQRALKENTDISFTYEPYGSRGRGGKILALKFIISKNEDFIDQLSLDDFIEEKKKTVDELLDELINKRYIDRINFLSEACNNEFNEKQMIVLNDKMCDIFSDELIADKEFCYEYLRQKYNELEMRDYNKEVKNRFSYFLALIGK